jgi:phage portal protein BeeE
MVPSNGNIYLVISRNKRTNSPAFPLLTPELPMVVDIITKGVYVPNRELKQKAY